MFYKDPIFWISEIFIIKKERKKGYALLLYEEIYKIAKKKGYSKIYCDIYDVNTYSITYHLKKKFKPIYTVYEKKI